MMLQPLPVIQRSHCLFILLGKNKVRPYCKTQCSTIIKAAKSSLLCFWCDAILPPAPSRPAAPLLVVFLSMDIHAEGSLCVHTQVAGVQRYIAAHKSAPGQVSLLPSAGVPSTSPDVKLKTIQHFTYDFRSLFMHLIPPWWSSG